MLAQKTGFKIAILVLWSSSAYSATVCPVWDGIDPSSSPNDTFDDFIIDGEMGGSGCNSELCDAITAWEQSAAENPQTETAIGFLDEIRESALLLPTDQPGVMVLQKHLVEWQQLLATADILVLPTAVWQPAHFVLFPHRDDEIDFEETFRQNCPDKVSQCQDMFENSACVYTHAVLQRRVLLRLLDKDRQATIAYLHQLNKRWTAFNSGGRALFPWELAINGMLYQRKADSRGFVEPPNYQIAILHPTVALEYQDSGSGDFNDAIVLELLGWYRWRWGGDDGSTMTKPFGASLITSWTGDNELGYGAMVHLPKNWSIGVTRRSISGKDETTFLLSVDLGKFLVKEEKLRQNLIDKLSQ